MALGKVIAALIVALSMTSAIYSQNKNEFKSEIGIAEDNKRDKILCLIIPNPNIKEGTSVSLVLFQSVGKQQHAGTAVVEKKLTASCSHNPDAGNIFYSLKLVSGDLEDYRLGVALINPTNKIQVLKGAARIDLNNDGKGEFFRKCTSNEGLHFTVWSGKPLRGERLWHSYYYLGYDVEPSCQDKDAEYTDDSEN